MPVEPPVERADAACSPGSPGALTLVVVPGERSAMSPTGLGPGVNRYV